MRAGEWSRSRYWLGHFLYSRHTRPRIAWDDPSPPGREDLETAAWLWEVVSRHGLARAWVIRRATAQYHTDPAYVQCLRLVLREQQHHRDLVTRLHRHWRMATPRMTAAGKDPAKPLGVRFRLSVQLMSDVADLVGLEAIVHDEASDPALRGVAATLARERAMHVTFMTERLAHEFADFQFVRRNLRRYRLRTMFAAILAVRYGPFGGGFAVTSWRRFASILEALVPYRRDELIRLLTLQRDRPFDRPG